MKPATRLQVLAPLFGAALVAASIVGSASTASAMSCTLNCGSVQGPDLTVGVSASPNPVQAATTHKYVLQVANNTWYVSLLNAPRPWPGANLTNVRVHLSAYPSDEQFVGYTNDTGSGFQCYVPAEYFGFDVRCVGGSIPTNTFAQITITTKAPSRVGGYTTTATVDPYNEIAESNENNNTASVAFSVN
jgi:CARDB protein